MSDTTSTLELVGRPEGRGASTPLSLVLLYAPYHAEIAPAFAGNPLVIGREPPPGGVRLPDSAASRVHARISKKDDGWVIADLESRNGTIKNGRFVEGEEPLEELDEIRVGSAIFKVAVEPPETFSRIDAPSPGPLVGGASMKRVREEIARIAPTALSVLVRGETGTGKELVARAIHEASGRRGKLAAVNCAAIPAALLESELFGAKRGAYTGADRDRVGHVRAANGGTLFLDEIGDMPLEAQAKLLRLLETREVIPLGAETSEKVDVRVVCATHRDLGALVASGAFRADLYARINGHTIRLPALRERKEDLFALLRFFLARERRSDLGFGLSFMIAALHYDWPYNVRELASAVARAVALADGPVLEDVHLPDDVRDAMQDYGKKGQPAAASKTLEARGTPSEEDLRALLAEHRGSVAAVARALARDRVQIRRWLKRYAIDAEEYRR